MARLPDVRFLGPRPDVRPTLNIVQGGADPMPRAVAGLGQAIAGVGADMDQRFDAEQRELRAKHDLAMRERAAAQKAQSLVTISEARVQLEDEQAKLSEAIANGTADKTKAAQLWSDTSKKITDKALMSVPGELQDAARADFISYNGRLGNGVEQAVRQRDRGDIAAGIAQVDEYSQRLARTNPKGAQELFVGTLRGLGPFVMSPSEIATREAAWKERTAVAKYELAIADAETTGSGLIELRTQIRADQALDPQRQAALIHRINVLTDRGHAEAKQGLASRAQDVQAMALGAQPVPDGFAPTKQEAIAAYGARGADWWQENVGNYVDMGAALRRMRDANVADRRALVAEAAPATGEGFAGKARMQQVLRQANEAIEGRLKEDPAAYAMEVSGRVQRAQTVMARVVGDQAAPEVDKSAAVDFFARTTLAEQARLGAKMPALLPKGQVEAIAQQFHSPREGGQTAADMVASLEQQWGRHWPAVYGQLAREAKLPAAALVIPNMADRGARARLAMLSQMKDDDLKALLPPAESRAVREKLQDQFSGAASSFLTQGPGGIDTIAKVMQSAEKLALFYRSKGSGAGDAAEQAFKETLGHAYTFADTYRIPNGERPDMVQEGAAVAMRDLDAVAPFAAPRGVTKEAASAQTLDAVRKSGQWIAKDDESGLRLIARDASGQIYAVRRPDGTPVEFTWAKLRASALDERTAQQLNATRRTSGAR